MGEVVGLRLVEGGGGTAAEGAPSRDHARELRAKTAAAAATNGANAYTDFILKHGRRPDPEQAAVIGRLIGKRVRASDGSMQPQASKGERAASKKARRIQSDEARVDAELSRACDALSFLAQNECDPSVLISRATPLEEQEIAANLEKALEWIGRFAHGWQSYVQTRCCQAEGSATASGERAGTKRLVLIRCGDQDR